MIKGKLRLVDQKPERRPHGQSGQEMIKAWIYVLMVLMASFHFSSKERQCQRMFKLPHNCTHLTRQQSNAQNSPSQASTVHEQYFHMFKLDLEKAEEPEINLPTSVVSSKKQESSRKTSTSTLLITPKPLTAQITTSWTVGVIFYFNCTVTWSDSKNQLMSSLKLLHLPWQ